MAHLSTANQVIDALGGTRKTSISVGVSEQSVSAWRKSDHIPPRYVDIITDLIGAEHHTADRISVFGILPPRNKGEIQC